MKKLLTAAAISIVGFFAVSGVGAVDASGEITLDDSQVVVVDQRLDGDAWQIADTNYYKTTVGNIKRVGLGSANVYPVLNYKTELVVDDPIEPQDYVTLLDGQDFWDEMPAGADQTVVAVVDGGFALSHEDLAGRWLINDGEYGVTAVEGSAPNCTSRSLPLDKSCNNLDDDGNDYVDDWRGWDFIDVDNDPSAGTQNPTADGVNHGTVVAGLVGITANNSLGAASINWKTQIMPLQIFNDDGEATSLELAEAIAYAIDQGVDVINLSLGGTESDAFIDALLEEAHDAGIIVTAAAGNCGGASWSLNGCDYEGQMLYPAISEYVVAIGASDLNDVQASFSSRSALLDVVAPGSGEMVSSDYTSTNEINAYTAEIYGTSFSTPIVSGLAAALKSQWPTATADDIRDLLVDSALKVSGMSGSLSTTRYGFGRVRPVEAMVRATSCQGATYAADINCDDSVGLLDLSILASQWQKQYTGRSDSNNSGLVDILDLSLLASQWGR